MYITKLTKTVNNLLCYRASENTDITPSMIVFTAAHCLAL